MSGNGRRIGTPNDTRRTLPRPAAFLAIHGRRRARQLRPATSEHQDSAQGPQGRLPSLRAQLLQAVPPGGASCRANRHINQPSGFPVCGEAARGRGAMNRRSVERRMKTDRRANDNGNQDPAAQEADDSVLSRRNILLGSSALVAAATLTSVALARSTKAAPAIAPTPAQGPPPSGRKPNVLIIWGDDVGIANISAYLERTDGLRDARHRPHSARRLESFSITMANNLALQGGPPS